MVYQPSAAHTAQGLITFLIKKHYERNSILLSGLIAFAQTGNSSHLAGCMTAIYLLHW